VSPEAIESAIEQLIRARFDQGQFDHCDITARDLMMVRGVFARLLSGLHHARVAYPPNVSAAQADAGPILAPV
jgi:membrane-associated HD superfamily phosphohydrolase